MSASFGRNEARIGESFKPHPDAGKLLYAYLLIPALPVAALMALIIGALFYVGLPEAWIVAAGLLIPYLAAVGIAAYWIPKYLSTVIYTLAEDRVVYEGGVWFKRKSYVPYNRITNIDVLQGPLSRQFGLGKVSIQTAGYSGASSSGVRFAEISIFGVKNFEQVKDAIISVIIKFRPVAVETGVEASRPPIDAELLDELKRIRVGIEAMSNKWHTDAGVS